MALRRNRLSNGFTLLELLVALAVLALLAAVAFPGFAQIIEANRVVSATNDFKTALNYARSEAVRRNRSVSVTPLEEEEWHMEAKEYKGWKIQDPSDTKKSLRIWTASGDGVIVSVNPPAITFNSLGRLPNNAAVQISISINRDSQVRFICLAPSGLSRMQDCTNASDTSP